MVVKDSLASLGVYGTSRTISVNWPARIKARADRDPLGK